MPWKPFWFSTAATPLPFIVRATTTVGFPVVATRLAERLVDRVDVVPVDLDRVPAERLGARDVDVEIPADHRLAALAEPVHVDDRREVVELEVRACSNASHIEPSAISLSPQQHPHAVREVLEVLAASAMPTPIGSPWPSEPVATSTHGMRGVGMALEHAAELAVASRMSSSVTTPAAR